MTIDELLEEVDAGLQHRGGWYSLQIPSTTEQLAAEVRRLRGENEMGRGMYSKVWLNAIQANREVDRLRERERVLVEFAESMVEWSEAYPKAIFQEPTPEQVQAVCKGLGFSIDSISAMILRIFTKPVGDRARAALEAVKE